MPSLRTIVLIAEPVTPAGFAPFGALPSDEGSEGDLAEVEFLWNDGSVNYISHTRDEVQEGAVRPDVARCSTATTPTPRRSCLSTTMR